jgi:hypothetical protein
MQRTKELLLFFALLLCSVMPLCAQDFGIFPISDSLFTIMNGSSYKEGCPISRSELRYVRVKHYDAQGHEHQGELVCNRQIADDLLEIFTELYRQRYPIERMRLIDNYGADDERSMQANNTSCFCFRPVTGSTKLSAHARGMAVDVNPLYNPCVRHKRDGSLSIQPETAKPYINRHADFDYKIDRHDLCYRLFTQHGFQWGGEWRSLKDYQHFEK